MVLLGTFGRCPGNTICFIYVAFFWYIYMHETYDDGLNLQYNV